MQLQLCIDHVDCFLTVYIAVVNLQTSVASNQDQSFWAHPRHSCRCEGKTQTATWICYDHCSFRHESRKTLHKKSVNIYIYIFILCFSDFNYAYIVIMIRCIEWFLCIDIAFNPSMPCFSTFILRVAAWGNNNVTDGMISTFGIGRIHIARIRQPIETS